MKHGTVPQVSENRPPRRDTSQTITGHSPRTVENTANPQLAASPGTEGHSGTHNPGRTDHCLACGAELNWHNATGLCAECKLDARNARLAGTIGNNYSDTIAYLTRDREPVLLDDAIDMLRRHPGRRLLDEGQQRC